MSPDAPQPATLVYNARAGSSHRAPPEDLRAALRASGYETELWISASPDPLAAFLDTLTGPLFLAGGDGTLRAAALHLAGRADVVLGIIPMGTANNVARALGLGTDPMAAARALRGARPWPLDLGRVRGGWGEDLFLESCGCGLFADVLDDYGPHLPKSPVRALGSLLEAYGALLPMVVRVAVDGVPAPGPPLSLLEVMNTPSTGNGLHLAPGADPGDGLLNLVRVDGHARESLLAYAGAMLRGDFHDRPSVHSATGRTFTVSDYGQVWHIDTEVRRSPAPGGEVEISVWPGALRVLRPEQQ